MEKSLKALASQIWEQEHIRKDKSVLDTMVIAMLRARALPSMPLDPYATIPSEVNWEY